MSTTPAIIGIDYGKPDGDRTVAFARDPVTGEAAVVPLFVAEYIRTLEKEHREMRTAHERIASCESRFIGDCPDISQNLLPTISLHP